MDIYYEAYTYYKATLLYYLRLQGVSIGSLIQDFKDKTIEDLSDSVHIGESCFVSKDLREINMFLFSRIHMIPGININISPPALISTFNVADRQ